MTFVLIGVNHKSAPVEVRERLAIPESRLADATARLMEFPGVEEGMILSTCNRVELIVNVSRADLDLRGFLREYFEADTDLLAGHLYEYREREAMRHIFRVAASLDSMIVGEPQVLGQVKAAYAVACGVGALHSQLHALVSRAFAVAKRVRTETAIGSSAVSVASAAVDLATQIFGSLSGKHVYLVGAGKMSELAARHLMAGGAEAIFVANRTHARALTLAEKFQGTAIRFEELYDTADRADIVITSTGSPRAIFRREHGERFLHRRKNRPMFFIDIAVPRDVDPEMNKLDGIFVYDIDDLQAVVSANVASREREAARADEIVEVELQRFVARLQTQEAAPTIVSLQEHLENIRQAELDRMRGRLGKLTAEQESAVEALTRGIINKVLHTPITAIKNAAGDPESNTVIDHVRRIFNLNPKNLNPKNQDPKNSSPKSLDSTSPNARPISADRLRNQKQEEPLREQEKKATPS
ncbi:MAG: glutamyl-tRNA reductase [Acidobacteria bacterium]|nr:MAG: glutamyl-tRNA reductase [Acidobacteriota bacterium]